MALILIFLTMSKVNKYPFSTPQHDSDLRNASTSFLSWLIIVHCYLLFQSHLCNLRNELSLFLS